MQTTQEQLDEVNAAISAILTGAQEYKIGWRTVRRADLTVLFNMRKDLEDKLNKENGGAIVVGYFER